MIATRQLTGSDSGVEGAGRMGMWLLIASLTMLFGAALVGFLVIRMRSPIWPPPGSPSLPEGLWISTAILVVLSATLAWAGRAAGAGLIDSLRRLTLVSVALAIAFLVSQLASWALLAGASVFPEQNLLVWGFYTLTALHGAHVLGGLVPLVLVAIRARRGRYTGGGSDGVHLVAMYWHFLLATWVAILVVLLV